MNLRPLFLSLLMLPLTVVADEPSRIALFGGSSSATTYLPEEDKHHIVLQKALQERYPGQKAEVFNFADNGEFIARYLLKDRYEMHRKQLGGKGIDIAILRCGINDSKRFNPKEFAAQLKAFIELLRKDFPGVQVMLETGFYLDYPRHYTSDRNKVLNPYWETNRQVARELDLPLIDLYRFSEEATAKGDWDIRIRSQNEEKYPKKPTRFYWKPDLDETYGDDVAWFTDVHPSPHGVRMAVRAEMEVLGKRYPEKLPTGAQFADTPRRDQAFFSQYLDTPVERLELRKKNPDLLQSATDPALPPQKSKAP